MSVINHRLHPDTEQYRAYFAVVEEQLRQGRHVTLSFGGDSMYPTLWPSDRITIAPLAAGEEPQVGDVVFFRQPGHCVVHRVVSRHNARYKLQGDNNYGTESISRWDILGRLEVVERADGRRIAVGSREWERISRRSLVRRNVKHFAVRWLGSKGRRQVRPWYFIVLFFLMWAPLNGIGVSLNNYLLGIRFDHLVHATVFIPCTLYLMDFTRHRSLVWLLGVAIGLLTETGQYFLPFRSFDINDMIANLLGVSFGWALVLYILRVGRRPRRYPVPSKREGCR